jgi:hypothetical protein
LIFLPVISNKRGKHDLYLENDLEHQLNSDRRLSSQSSPPPNVPHHPPISLSPSHVPDRVPPWYPPIPSPISFVIITTIHLWHTITYPPVLSHTPSPGSGHFSSFQWGHSPLIIQYLRSSFKTSSQSVHSLILSCAMRDR